MKKRAAAALCAGMLLLLSIAMAGARAVGRVTVYFMVVNETVLELRADTMPFMSGGDVYVPYTMFDPNVTGINLGVFALYGSNTAMVYDRSGGMLVFDLAANTTETSDGTLLSQTAIRRNSMVFLPVALVCSYFDLDWNMPVDPDYGFIVRVVNSSARLSYDEFLVAAKYVMTLRYNEYVRSIGGGERDPEPSASSASPSPTPTPTPTPTPAVTHTPAPSVPGVSPPPTPQGGTVYLAFSCDSGGSTADIAAALERRSTFGLFFFRPEDLTARDDEVRALAAAGHKIGLLLDGADEAAREEQARYGNELLSHILRSGASIALTETGQAPPVGWFRWTTDVDGRVQSRTANERLQDIVRDAVGPLECFLLLDDDGQTAGLLPRLLRNLEDNGCQFRLALETVLPQQYGAPGGEDSAGISSFRM